jgi:hypothetical protein
MSDLPAVTRRIVDLLTPMSSGGAPTARDVDYAVSAIRTLYPLPRRDDVHVGATAVLAHESQLQAR